MGKRVKMDFDSEGGLAAFLRGSEVAGMVRSSGNRIAAAAGRGFEADTWISPTRGTSRRGNSNPPRVVSGVAAETPDARRRQSRDNVLQRARDAGRV